jgi:hypothetical protein
MPEPTTDTVRALHLLEAASAVAADTEFHIRYGSATDYAEHYAALLRRLADDADPMVGSLHRDGFGVDGIAAMLATPKPSAGTIQIGFYASAVTPLGRAWCSGEDGFCPAHGFHRHSPVQPGEEQAAPPHHRWYTETLDDAANEWAPGMRFTDRAVALDRYRIISERYPLWKDGTPVKRRFVRETTTYTVTVEDASETQAAHSCSNCEGIDPDTCLMNPDRPLEQCPAAESVDYGLQCQKPVGHELHTFEQSAVVPDTDGDHSCAESGCTGDPAADEPAAEEPCCSDPTCACDVVNAAGRCACAKWDNAPEAEDHQTRPTEETR